MVGYLISQSLINVLTRYYKGKGKHDWQVEKNYILYINDKTTSERDFNWNLCRQL